MTVKAVTDRINKHENGSVYWTVENVVDGEGKSVKFTSYEKARGAVAAIMIHKQHKGEEKYSFEDLSHIIATSSEIEDYKEILAGSSLKGVELARKGRHSLKTGIWEVTDEVLDQLQNNFKSGTLSVVPAPGDIDHVEAGPALGWITEVYREGDSLYGNIDDIPEDFSKELKERKYRNRSLEAIRTSDGQHYITGFAWLGAKKPGVKNMADLKVATKAPTPKDGVLIFCSLNGEGTIFNSDSEVEMEIKELEDQIKAEKENFAKLQAEAAEKDTKLKIAEEKARAAEEKVKAAEEKADLNKRMAEADKFMDDNIKAGRITPAMRDAGLKALYVHAAASEAVIEIKAEEGKSEKLSPLALLKQIIASIPDKALLSLEDDDSGPGEQDHTRKTGVKDVSALLSARVDAYKKAGKTHKEAVDLVKAEAATEGLQLRAAATK